MTWLGWMWNDLPMRLAVVGSVVAVTVSGGLLRWVSQHYVGGAATDWRLTTWDDGVSGEVRAGRGSGVVEENGRDPRVVG